MEEEEDNGGAHDIDAYLLLVDDWRRHSRIFNFSQPSSVLIQDSPGERQSLA